MEKEEIDDIHRKLVNDLESKDDRGKIISIHLYMKFWIHQINRKFTGKTKTKANLSLAQNAKLLHAVDFFDDILLNNILIIIKIRNIYAHSLTPSKEKVQKLIKKLIIRKNLVGEGYTFLEMACIQTILDLDSVYDTIEQYKPKTQSG